MTSIHPDLKRNATLLAASTLLTLLALAPTGCGKSESASAKTASTGPKPVTITSAKVETRDMQRSVHVVGSLAALEKVTLSNRVVGNVVELKADLGHRVAPGTVLAQIEPERYELALKQAQQSEQETLAKLGLTQIPPLDFNIDQTPQVQKALSELNAVKIKFERAEILYKQQLIKDFEYLDTKAMMQVADSALINIRDTTRAMLVSARQAHTLAELRQKDLADATILAPKGLTPDGTKIDSYTISERRVGVGEYLREGTPIFTLVADKTLKLKARVPERFLAQVATGQMVNFKVEAYPDTFSGKLTAIDPTVDQANRTFLIEATVDNAAGRLRSGSFVQADILTTVDSNAIMVPITAVTSFAGVTKIFVLSPDRSQVRQLEVQTGTQLGNLIEITSGNLKPTDEVATSGLTKLVDSSKITLRPTTTAPSTTTAPINP